MHLSHQSRMRAKLATASVTAVALGAMVLPPATAAPVATGAASPAGLAASAVQVAAAPQGTIESGVRGTFGRNGTVRGTFTPDRFFVKRGETYATGILRATLRRGNGSLVGNTSRRITVPVKNGSASSAAQRGGSCDILNLVLGPLDLNLLGLRVQLNRVRLDITAVPGAGNLLGNLLCAVVGLLDGDGILSQLRLANVLNRILSILRA